MSQDVSIDNPNGIGCTSTLSDCWAQRWATQNASLLSAITILKGRYARPFMLERDSAADEESACTSASNTSYPRVRLFASVPRVRVRLRIAAATP